MTKWPAALLAAFIGIGLAAAQGAAPAPSASIKGEVLEVKDAGPYTYLRLKTPAGETWAAVKRVSVAKGAKVTIEDVLLMKDFQSRSLDRKFDTIALGTLAGAPRDATPVAAGDPHAKLASIGEAAAPIKVAKAAGPEARTVAEIVARRSDLRDKAVVVRGQVVKFTPGVMGKNWVHLRDGSGSASDGTDDILVTTNDETRIGEVVTARGIVHTDKDFGAGYAYRVLVEEAKLRK